MNIIIPLGGKGERFSKNGYTTPKPLIPIFEKCMIDYVIDNLTIYPEDKVFIIYNSKLDNDGFSKYIQTKYMSIQLIQVNDTKGAVETLFLGIQYILQNCTYNNKCLLLDCDTFYTENIVKIFRESTHNMVFYTKNEDTTPIYSYIELDADSTIINIAEKQKISHNANTGAYAFNDIGMLHNYCKYVLDNNITFNNEPYTSCVISVMIKDNAIFKGYELDTQYVVSLGTPEAVQNYIDRTYAFLFDLDGTLVISDEIYFDVWTEILSKYNIVLTKEIFTKFIQGNNDNYVLNSMLMNVNITLPELSAIKDKLFIENICKVKVINGVYDIIREIKMHGHKICIVTNCNKQVAHAIIKHMYIDKSIDFVISSNDCECGKPSSEPYQKAIEKYNIKNSNYFIFEDSKSGLLSGKGVNPKLLVGIESNYTKDELINHGANLAIPDFCNLKIEHLINSQENNINYFKNMIKKNSSILEIKDVLINENKLKGGFIADVISYEIITESGYKYAQILKYENTQENNLSNMAKRLELYEREYYFYTNISPHVNISIPKFYNLIINENLKKTGIVLENLLEKNYKINLNLNIENIEVTLKIVDNMAKMHSKFWNKNLKQLFPELKYSNDPTFHPFFKEFIDENYEMFKNKWIHIFTKNQENACDKIYKDFTNIQLRFSQGNHLTFIHGDIKSPNIFYDVHNDYEPYFIDWQHCAIGKGVQDLIFFIIESFDITNMKFIFYLTKYYYYKKLLEYGVSNYSFETYESDICDAICYVPFFTSVWFGTTPSDELIDKNFPYFFINKLFYLIKLVNL